MRPGSFPRGNGVGQSAGPPRRQRQTEHACARGPSRPSTPPSIRPASSRAIASPSPLPVGVRALDPVEAVEDPLEVLGRDARAVVGHVERHGARIAPRWRRASRSCRRACGPARWPRAPARSAGRAPRRRPPRSERPDGTTTSCVTRSRRRSARAPRRAPAATSERLTSTRSTWSCPASRRERSSRFAASRVSRSTCSRVVVEEACARLVVHVLVREQLEEPGEREERRPQLVRCVRDELLAREVELGELHAHPVERRRRAGRARRRPWSTSGSSKWPLGDPLGGSLDPADPTRVDPGGPAAQQPRDEQRGAVASRRRCLTTAPSRADRQSEPESRSDVAGEQLHRRLAVLDPAARRRVHARSPASAASSATGSRASSPGDPPAESARTPSVERRPEDLVEDDARPERDARRPCTMSCGPTMRAARRPAPTPCARRSAGAGRASHRRAAARGTARPAGMATASAPPTISEQPEGQPRADPAREPHPRRGTGSRRHAR